ncbi:MAG: catalase [Clostridia bacterium]|nr:catalase [Clostridia bacterium]
MYLKNVIKHFSVIIRHKWVVFKLCCRVGIPWRGFVHDLSKFSPTEFWESVKYFNGKHSPIIDCKRDKGYSEAWLHHKGRNKHHSDYWIDLNGPDGKPILPIIPYPYIAEMLCDKLAAGIIYEGKKWTKEFELEYWLNERKNIMVNNQIKELITDFPTQVSKEGIKKVLTKRNVKSLYKKYCIDYIDNSRI